MTRALSAHDMSVQFGMTPRYWTRMAAEGKVPGAWQPSGTKGKWLFDKAAVERWQRSRRKGVEAWPGYTSGARRSGDVPSVTGRNIGSPSAPAIDALLKNVCANG